MNFGPSLVGGLTAGVMLIGVNYVMPEPSYMAIRELSYSDGYIILDRAVRPPDVVADFVVSVVSEETGATVCKGTGEAEFETDESRRKTFTLDQFSGDPGCLERLDGKYTLYKTYVPRDGRAPVALILDFEVNR